MGKILGTKQTVSIYIRVTEKGKQRFLFVNPRKPQLRKGTFYLRFEENGKRYWQRVDGDLAAAITIKAELEARRLVHKKSIAPKPKESKRKNLVELRDDFLETKRLSRKRDGSVLDKETVDAYEQHSDDFLKIAGGKYPEDVTGNDLRRYMKSLADQGRSHRTICNRYTAVSTFLLFCGVDHKKLLPYSERPTPHDETPVAYKLEEVQQFLFRVSRERDRLFFEFALKSGGRDRELTTLEWTDLELGAEPTVTFRARKPHLRFRNKTGKARQVPLERSLVDRLIAWRAKKPSKSLVFGTHNDKEDGHYLEVCKLTAFRAGLNCGKCVSRNIHTGKPVLDRKGRLVTCNTHPVCRHWRLHRWRDTFATWALRGGVDPRTVQAWLGHTSLEMTMRYLAPGEGKFAQQAANMAFGGLNLQPESLRA